MPLASAEKDDQPRNSFRHDHLHEIHSVDATWEIFAPWMTILAGVILFASAQCVSLDWMGSHPQSTSLNRPEARNEKILVFY